MTPEIGKLVPSRPVANSQPATRMTAEMRTTFVTLTHSGAMSEPILRWMRRVRISQKTIHATPASASSMVGLLNGRGRATSGRYPAPMI